MEYIILGWIMCALITFWQVTEHGDLTLWGAIWLTLIAPACTLLIIFITISELDINLDPVIFKQRKPKPDDGCKA